MKKPFYISFILLIAALVFFNFYKYREQSLGELVDINRVEELYIVLGDQVPVEFELVKASDETIKKMSDFLGQYQVKRTNKEGWISKHKNERFELFFGYEDGEIERYTFKRDVVVSNGVYKIVNPPLDYNVIERLEREVISKDLNSDKFNN